MGWDGMGRDGEKGRWMELVNRSRSGSRRDRVSRSPSIPRMSPRLSPDSQPQQPPQPPLPLFPFSFKFPTQSPRVIHILDFNAPTAPVSHATFFFPSSPPPSPSRFSPSRLSFLPPFDSPFHLFFFFLSFSTPSPSPTSLIFATHTPTGCP